MGRSLRWGDEKGFTQRRGERRAAFPPQRHAELGSASIVPQRPKGRDEKWTLKQVQGDGCGRRSDGDGRGATSYGCAHPNPASIKRFAR
jgi:hypothetical protein